MIRGRRNVVLVLIVAAIVAALWFNQHHGIKGLATETHSALCALKQDIAQRQRSSRQYLADVEAGRREPVPGISTADITQSIRNQQSTLDALEPLRCE